MGKEKPNIFFKEVDLETRLRIINEMMLQNYLVYIGQIPEGPWDDEKEEKYGSFRDFAQQLATYQIEQYKEWEKDGRPESPENKNKS